VIADRYRPIEQIATGGMATVWRAEDTVLGRFVAIKRLLPHLDGDPAASERFEREARAAAMLHHPGIVTVFDTGEDADGPYIVFELVKGATVADRLANSGPMSPSEVAGVVTQVAAALDHAHTRGVIHRDIKPSNLILEPEGRVRLADFGIARSVDDDSAITGPGELVGTLSYLAPEILTGGPATPATDIYSLGAVTHEMLAGRPPFSADTPAGLLDLVRTGSVSGLDGLAPDQMSAAVRAAISSDPEARPHTAGEFAAELVGATTLVLASAPSRASAVVSSEEPTVVRPAPPPPPPAPPPPPPADRRRSAWPLVLLLITIIGLAAAAVSFDGDPGSGATTNTTFLVTTVPSTVATSAAPATAAPTTIPPTTTLLPTATTVAEPTPESVAEEIGLLLASLEPPRFGREEVGQVEERVEAAMGEWADQDREDLVRELERAFEQASDLEESPERALLVDRLAELAELMGFRVDRIIGGGGDGGGDGDD
jgi:serine/threonine-protein kinase